MDRRGARKSKQHFDETKGNETYLTGKNAFIVNIHNIICDGLIMELVNRSEVYLNISENEINLQSETLITKYSRDIDIIQFNNEVLQLVKFLKEVKMTDLVGIDKLLIGGLQSTYISKRFKKLCPYVMPVVNDIFPH
ncbi:hypothetical protein JTB14_020958 [Gonioctena quinquepunctata]|nr:hypothetical protein JTB14_020958 [Gonioctena quinquepunctata]